MRTALSLFIILIAMGHVGCNMIQKAEIMRRQNVRNEANRYATGNWVERRQAVREIAKYYGPEKNELIIGILYVALQDPHPLVRIDALNGLYRLKLESTHVAVKNIAADEKDPNVRMYAIKALRVFRDPSDIDIFIKGFQDDDWLIREESIKGLLVMNDITVKSRLIPYIIAAINDPRASIAITTLRRLKTKDEKLYTVIVNKFNSNTKNKYSLIEATLIGLYGYKLDDKTKTKVINLLVHPNLNIRLLALKVLRNDKILTLSGK